ncbi:MAG: CPBP family intramembrane metalloprotease [Methanomassiliicoccaceae archaeon]|nr:CPBP family intramembrane metalloprotease [Methanomassiliicoccaceae archaeon]
MSDDPHQAPTDHGNTCDEYAPQPAPAQRSIIEIILLAASIIIVAVAIFEVMTLIINFPDIFSFMSSMPALFYMMLPGAPTIFSLEGFASQLWWLLVAIIILTCVATAARKFICAVRSAKGAGRFHAVENTAAFWVCVFLTASALIAEILTFIVIQTGGDIPSPFYGGKRNEMFLFANAAVWEEIFSRLLLIGVPMVIISLIVTKKKESLKCLSGGFGMSMSAFILIMISGAIFGLAHFSTWEGQAWMIVWGAVMGVFLGYVFVRFGLYAAILLHFVNNYFSSFDWMGIGGFGSLVYWLLVGIGVIALIYIMMRLWRFEESKATLPLFRNGHMKEG